VFLVICQRPRLVPCGCDVACGLRLLSQSATRTAWSLSESPQAAQICRATSLREHSAEAAAVGAGVGFGVGFGVGVGVGLGAGVGVGRGVGAILGALRATTAGCAVGTAVVAVLGGGASLVRVGAGVADAAGVADGGCGDGAASSGITVGAGAIAAYVCVGSLGVRRVTADGPPRT